MKNTTFRKKALLSSVAMLLVALVALGSATFAWFTQNPTVNAEGLTLHATAGAGLQILSSTAKTAGDDFGTKTVINAEKKNGATVTKASTAIGTPVSIDLDVTDSITWRTTTAGTEDNYAIAKDEDGAIAAAITAGTPGYTETIYLRSSIPDAEEAVVVKSAKVTMEQSNSENSTNPAQGMLYSAIRVTIANGKNIIGTWSPDGVANDYLTANGPKSEATFTALNTKVPMNLEVGYATKDNTSEATALTLYVWLDGEDDACKTSNVENLKELVDYINVEFTTAE